MSLRDFGVVDYYIPLFAGPDAAKRARFRLGIPLDMYAPYYPGSGTGGGDGGYETPVDSSIVTPTITFPNDEDFEGITDCDTITSSAFASINGQTHVGSRWFGELLSLTGDTSPVGTPSLVYDSGPDIVNLTSLDLAGLGAAPNAAYQVRVRYKGSNGGWSDFSPAQVFVMADCGYECGVQEYIQDVVLNSFDGSVLTTYPFTITPPAETALWNDRKAYIQECGWDDTGTVLGNVDNVSGSAFFGPDKLVSDDGGNLTGTIVNTVGPATGFTATIRWTGTL